MNERYRQLAAPEAKPTLKALLDHGVDMAVMHWYFMETRPRELVPGSGVMTDSHLEEYRQAEMETALFGHARDLAETGDTYNELASLSWARYAQQSLRRMSHRHGVVGMAQCAKNRVFTNPADQVEIYDEMSENLIVLAGPPIDASHPVEYAVRVALREIVVDSSPEL